MKLSGKTAVITGGARGIGKASALALAKEGADIAFADLLEREAAETVAEIEALDRRAIFTHADVGKRADCERLFADAIGTLGRVDILLNNAASSVRKLLIDLEVADVEKTWGPTLWSVIHCSQLAARQMIAQGDGGSIISISSVQGVRPYALSTAYNGAKAAVIHMSRTWAVELAQHGIRRQHHRARLDRYSRRAESRRRRRDPNPGRETPIQETGEAGGDSRPGRLSRVGRRRRLRHGKLTAHGWRLHPAPHDEARILNCRRRVRRSRC